MRINKFVALASGLSRRAADAAISEGRVVVNGDTPSAGQQISPSDVVTLDGQPIYTNGIKPVTIMLNKPAGYVVSRDGQGSPTIYELLPTDYQVLKPVGRLDKDSSGLLLLTNDGQMAHELTHPSFAKTKVYEVQLNKSLIPADQLKIEHGVQLEDGLSALKLTGSGDDWTVRMHEGRNRQIRRTFAALGYTVTKLHRTHFGDHKLYGVGPGQTKIL